MSTLQPVYKAKTMTEFKCIVELFDKMLKYIIVDGPAKPLECVLSLDRPDDTGLILTIKSRDLHALRFNTSEGHKQVIYASWGLTLILASGHTLTVKLEDD